MARRNGSGQLGLLRDHTLSLAGGKAFAGISPTLFIKVVTALIMLFGTLALLRRWPNCLAILLPTRLPTRDGRAFLAVTIISAAFAYLLFMIPKIGPTGAAKRAQPGAAERTRRVCREFDAYRVDLSAFQWGALSLPERRRVLRHTGTTYLVRSCGKAAKQRWAPRNRRA
jgi:hypothetical protein